MQRLGFRRTIQSVRNQLQSRIEVLARSPEILHLRSRRFLETYHRSRQADNLSRVLNVQTGSASIQGQYEVPDVRAVQRSRAGRVAAESQKCDQHAEQRLESLFVRRQRDSRVQGFEHRREMRSSSFDETGERRLWSRRFCFGSNTVITLPCLRNITTTSNSFYSKCKSWFFLFTFSAKRDKPAVTRIPCRYRSRPSSKYIWYKYC